MFMHILLKIRMMWVGITGWRQFQAATMNPVDIQNKVLMKILRSQSVTDFGKKHCFGQIQDINSYRDRVSVQEFEDIRSYIHAQQDNSRLALNAEPPILYALTSGTTGAPKYVPMTQAALDNYKYTQQLVAYSIYQNYPDAYSGQLLAITSAAIEGYLDNGTPFGSMSGVINKSMPALMRKKYVIPSEIFEIDDQNQEYYQIARYAVAEKNITMIATANPSTLLKLNNVINEQFEMICAEIKSFNPARAASLDHLVAGSITIRDLWPNLSVITTWIGGNCRLLLPEIEKLISRKTKVIELGYLSSEFRGGLVVDSRTNQQVPCIHETYYEFVEQHMWENGTPEFLNIDQLELGKHYYPLVTTVSGLYRYNINDVIKITGFFNQTPSFEFLQKGKGVVNLTGEKLYESQLIEAIDTLKRKHQANFVFFMMLGDPLTLTYTIYIESPPIDVFLLDDEISKLNIEFLMKLESDRLQATHITFVNTGCGEAFKQYYLDQGQRENQFKLVHLQQKSQCMFTFDEWVL